VIAYMAALAGRVSRRGLYLVLTLTSTSTGLGIGNLWPVVQPCGKKRHSSSLPGLIW